MKETLRSNCCVIIVTHNAGKWIKECLDGLKDSTYPTDLILIDNNSTDDTIDLVLRNSKPRKLFLFEENLGFGKANNLGIEYGVKNNYEFFFLINQDVYVNSYCIEYLISTIKNDNKIGILSPIHLNGKGDDLDSGFKAGIKSKELVTSFYKSTWKKNIIEVKFVNAAAWMIRRNTFMKVGLFHPLFYHYGEDKNYASRIKFAKFSIKIDRRASIRHDRENRGFNLLKDKAELNFNRICKQILLNPFNGTIRVILIIKVLSKIIVITRGWPYLNRITFTKWAIGRYKEITKEINDFGGNDYNPFKG